MPAYGCVSVCARVYECVLAGVCPSVTVSVVLAFLLCECPWFIFYQWLCVCLCSCAVCVFACVHACVCVCVCTCRCVLV